MITCCPSCHTHFRVYAEQLSARAGQVRCGRCNRVFDALEHLIEEISAAPASAQNTASEAERIDGDGAEHAPEPTAGEVSVDARSEPVAAEPINIEAVAASRRSRFGLEFGTAAAPAIAARRWPWLLGVLLLFLILLAQAAYQYRIALALLVPAAKPYADALCATVGCELPLPRRIELMSIEASDLQADTTNPNVMVLSATLKNRAIFIQQYPLFELTLTDAQDQPLVRRVLAPQDYLRGSLDPQTGFAAGAEIAVKVFIEGSQVKATGYRLYLFYP
jgi:predicted Zn finger-like uncharacterized protein